MTFYKFLILVAIATFTMSCQNSEAGADEKTKTTQEKDKSSVKHEGVTVHRDQSIVDEKLIKDHLAKNNIDADKTASGLYYRIVEMGNENKMATPTSSVKVNYKGKLLSGVIFDQSPEGQPISFPLNRVIPGWTEGLQLVGEGGKIELIIPSKLAYGPAKVSTIPPNSVLTFDVTLLEVK